MNTIIATSHFDIYAWIVIPFLIFIARITDVSIGTVRLIFISRGYKYLAPIVGFFEVLIWILAISQIMKNLSNPVCYIAYAGGFATGNFVGMLIAEKLSLGVVMIRVITQNDSSTLVNYLKSADYGVTTLDGQGTAGEVKLVFTIVPRREAESVVSLINKFNPQAFYSIEEVGTVKEGVFPPKKDGTFAGFRRFFRPFRKGK